MQTEDIKTIAQKFGTPLYIYDGDKIKNNFLELRDCLSKQVDIFYSIKANPNVSIAALLQQSGAGAEVSSLAELETALMAGFTPQNIIVVGPYKSFVLLRRSLEVGVFAIVCESKQELYTISAIAKTLNCCANVALRINPIFSAQKAPLKMGGVSSQFGIDQEQILDNELLNVANTKIIGIHIYNGSRILDCTTIYCNVQNILNLANSLTKQWQKEFTMVDVGGGLGIPYFSGEMSPDLSVLKSQLIPQINNFKNRNRGTRLIFESGRFLVASGGIFVTQVQIVKQSKGEYFAITDGGTNCHMAAVGIGSVLKRNFPITCLTNSSDMEKRNYHLTGPLCTPGDVIAKNIQLPILKVGDLIVINNSGAYGPSASPINFLGHGHPAEVLVRNGEACLIRESDTYQDILHKQILVNQTRQEEIA